MKNLYQENVVKICRIEKMNKNKLFLYFFISVSFTILYATYILSNEELHFGYANTEVQTCGCSKCHTIELNGCNGCHNAQYNNNKSDDTTTGSDGSHNSNSNLNDNGPISKEDVGNQGDSPTSSDITNEENSPNSDIFPNKLQQKEYNNVPKK